MATTRYYLTTDAAGFTPTNFRGGWEKTSDAVTRALSTTKAGTATELNAARPAVVGEQDVCFYRGVSAPLAAGTVGGDFDMGWLTRQVSASGNFFTRVHAYITAGDADTVRGTLLTEAVAAVEWLTTNQAIAFPATATTPVAVQAGDRLVVELGARSNVGLAFAYDGTIAYGGTGADIADGNTAGGLAPWVELDVTEGAAALPSRTAIFIGL